ncbi:MAG: hypothetical protein N0E48_26670 [Candidatus Thiodiazotropha endolucinida]|nr:hypothetical protein [Candidatus Thiodiazotropha taylori]MCW4346912.1 hypothetical protein [Candidatus Thiodiazotropha endolucinida]
MKLDKWVPYVPDYDAWYEHFKDLSEGYVQPDHEGRYIVGSGRRNRLLKEMEEQRQKEIDMREQQKPVVKMVTPVAQAVEMAKSEIARKNGKRKKEINKPKRLKRYVYNPEDQL